MEPNSRKIVARVIIYARLEFMDNGEGDPQEQAIEFVLDKFNFDDDINVEVSSAVQIDATSGRIVDTLRQS